MEEKFYVIGPENGFLHMIPEAQTTKAKINKWDYIKLNSLCIAMNTIKKMKRQPMEWENITVNHIHDKVLTSKIHQKLLQLNS